MTPREIDAYVRAQSAAGADLYDLHRDALGRLDPDLVLTQDLCQVCAHELPDVAVWAIDGNGLIVRPGPRVVDGVEALASVLHPDGAPHPSVRAVGRVA